MKVKDLIKKLQEFNPESTVITTSSNFELNHSSVAVSHVHQYLEGLKTKKDFRDAFDGGTYSKEVWSIIGGTELVIVIS